MRVSACLLAAAALVAVGHSASLPDHPQHHPDSAILDYQIKTPEDFDGETKRPIMPDVDYYDCTGRLPGDYMHPSDCTRFMKCDDARRAFDFPCPECPANNPWQCSNTSGHGFNYLVFSLDEDACLWPRDEPCVVDEDSWATTTTTTQGGPIEEVTEDDLVTEGPDDDRLCDEEVKHGGSCLPKSAEDCKCGTCHWNETHTVFEYFWCDIEVPKNPTEDQPPGSWVHATCAHGDIWNPDLGTAGDCDPLPNWMDLDEEYRKAYKDCFRDECKDDGEGRDWWCQDPKDGDPCYLRDDTCSCGDCRPEDSTFWHFECKADEPGPDEDPRKPWTGTWVRHDCGHREFFDPKTRSCTADWSRLDGHVKDKYLKECFEVCENPTPEGGYCDDRYNPKDGDACNPRSDDCHCGRCVSNHTYEFVDCISDGPVGNPHDAWNGHWELTRCEEFYNPVTGTCARWDDLGQPARDHYLEDEECHWVVCLETPDDKACSNKYETRWGNNAWKEQSCPAGRFYDHPTRGCRPCGDVEGCHEVNGECTAKN